jgi:hypothetical protein
MLKDIGHHPYIINLLGGDNNYAILEYLENHELFDYVSAAEKKFPE